MFVYIICLFRPPVIGWAVFVARKAEKERNRVQYFVVDVYDREESTDIQFF